MMTWACDFDGFGLASERLLAMLGTSFERVTRCREKSRGRKFALAQGLPGPSSQTSLSETLNELPGPSEWACPSDLIHNCAQLTAARKRVRSLMEFPADVARANRSHCLARMRCKRSFAAGISVPAVLPLDKTCVDELKDCYPDRSYYGGPTHECLYCGAVFWFQEPTKSVSAISKRKIVYNLCCRGSKISLKPYKILLLIGLFLTFLLSI